MSSCRNCGNDYDDSLNICPKCGAHGSIASPAGDGQKSAHTDDAQVDKMHKENRRRLIIMSCVFAAFILSGFFVHGQSIAYIIGAVLFFPVFVLPMVFMKKWAAMAVMLALLALVFTSMLGMIGGGYSTVLAKVFGAVSSVFFMVYIIVIFQNMDEMR